MQARLIRHRKEFADSGFNVQMWIYGSMVSIMFLNVKNKMDLNVSEMKLKEFKKC
jgi:hypothetical protein